MDVGNLRSEAGGDELQRRDAFQEGFETGGDEENDHSGDPLGTLDMDLK